jgi:hypothetical protein
MTFSREKIHKKLLETEFQIKSSCDKITKLLDTKGPQFKRGSVTLLKISIPQETERQRMSSSGCPFLLPSPYKLI